MMQPRAWLPSAQLATALEFAIDRHGDQPRKGSQVPYVTHLLAVCSLVGEFGGDETQMIAALLHDAVEDTGGKPILLEIRTKFGDEVAAIVDGCTDDDTGDPGGRKRPWRARKLEYIGHLGVAAPEVLRVSGADKLHNTRSMTTDLHVLGDRLWDRFKGGRDGSLWYYRSVTEALQRRMVANHHDDGLQRLTAELDRAVTGLEWLAEEIARR